MSVNNEECEREKQSGTIWVILAIVAFWAAAGLLISVL